MEIKDLEFARKGMVQRFGHDNVIALATVENGVPAVRYVDGYYEDGAFYTITYALSNKMRQIAANPSVALAGEWFTARGVGENMGWVRDEKNKCIADKLCAAFAAWYDNGHTDETDTNTVILKVKLTDAVLWCDGTAYVFEQADFAG